MEPTHIESMTVKHYVRRLSQLEPSVRTHEWVVRVMSGMYGGALPFLLPAKISDADTISQQEARFRTFTLMYPPRFERVDSVSYPLSCRHWPCAKDFEDTLSLGVVQKLIGGVFIGSYIYPCRIRLIDAGKWAENWNVRFEAEVFTLPKRC